MCARRRVELHGEHQAARRKQAGKHRSANRDGVGPLVSLVDSLVRPRVRAGDASDVRNLVGEKLRKKKSKFRWVRRETLA